MNLGTGALILLGGYLLGSIPTGYLVGKAKGIDIREHGSKNIGATNVSRTLGKKYGIFVFFCDALKGVLAARLAILLVSHTVPPAMQPAYAGILGSLACILGHNFPVWLKFKGGKGVATSLGMVIGLVPLSAAIAFGLWLILFLTTRYVSLASIIATLSVPATVPFLAAPGDRAALLVFTSLASLLIVVRHKANIVRLLNGTENRFTKKPKDT